MPPLLRADADTPLIFFAAAAFALISFIRAMLFAIDAAYAADIYAPAMPLRLAIFLIDASPCLLITIC